MTETIKKMLEDPESDNDELNARIWCWEEGLEFIYVDEEYIEYKRVGETTTVLLLDMISNFNKTTSLDAAMSIGAEELEGWYFDIISDETGSDCEADRGGLRLVEAHNLSTMPRAICHARIQALEYVRTQNDR